MSTKCRICGAPISAGEVCANCLPNSNPKISPDEKSKNTFKKIDNLDKYLIFTFTSLILYTIVSQILFYVYQIEMAVLTGCFFAAFGGEILMCALIKKLKLHKEAEIKKEDSTWQQ